MGTSHEVSSEDALAALASVEAGKAELADRLVTPVWYHPALGLLVGGLIATAAAHDPWVFVSAAVVYAVGCGVLVTSYRKLTGIWVSGLRHGPAGQVSLRLIVSLYAVAGLAALLDFGLGVRSAFLVAGVVAFGLVVVLGRRFDRALRDELRAHDPAPQ